MPKNTFFNLPPFKRKMIIDKTYDLFINSKYEDITIRDIASNAEISIGSFYQYFDDKDDMYLYLTINIAKRIFKKYKEAYGTIFLIKEVIPLQDILTEKEIAFDNTWYNIPVQVMMKFYFGEFSRELNSYIYEELLELQNQGRLKDNVDIDFVFYLYVTSMFNLMMYFKEKNITNSATKVALKNNFYQDIFINGILKHMQELH